MPKQRLTQTARALLATLMTLAVLFPALPAPAASDEPWVFEGGGWGHGVGMSQFGAKGRAEDGHSYQEILQHYYTDTSVASMPSDHWTRQPKGLWVGLIPNTEAVTIEAVGGALTVCQPADTCPPEPPYSDGFEDVTIDPDELWRFEADPDDSTQCRFRQVETGNLRYRPCDARLTKADDTDVRFKINGEEYARGEIRFIPASQGFHVVVTLSMEEYLYGLAEVPNDWPSEALKAQAVAGRGFALATAQARGGEDGTGKKSSCGCHLRSTTFDQVYAGWAKEEPGDPNLGERWTEAVDDTDREVLTHPESNQFFNVASTFYSSSNGGHSENNEYGFPGGTPQPWLRSVADSFSADPEINPLARWSVEVTDEAMAEYFGWDRALDAFIVEGPPGVRVRFTGVDDGSDVEKVLTGVEMRTLVKSIGFEYQPVLGGNTSVRVSPYFTAVTDPPGFDDIIGNTFEGDIEWLEVEGITKGCNPPENTLFCPDEDVTRGQMAAFLKRFLDLPEASEDYFGDDNGSTFEADINAIAEAGITKGCNPPDNTNYCPDDEVSREQMAAFIVRALGLGANDHTGFDDVATSNTFFNDISKLATADITKGCNPLENTN
ncbi:MAG: SpoIID/LytB domain-containing protein, partial [Actinomycetota bacterium]